MITDPISFTGLDCEDREKMPIKEWGFKGTGSWDGSELMLQFPQLLL